MCPLTTYNTALLLTVVLRTAAALTITAPSRLSKLFLMLAHTSLSVYTLKFAFINATSITRISKHTGPHLHATFPLALDLPFHTIASAVPTIDGEAKNCCTDKTACCPICSPHC